jgi:hypothetical protein
MPSEELPDVCESESPPAVGCPHDPAHVRNLLPPIRGLDAGQSARKHLQSLFVAITSPSEESISVLALGG